MTQEITFYAEGSNDPRPKSVRTMYVDGSSGKHFREGIDGELSHWRPNRTEEAYRAGTSTEICFKYLHAHNGITYDLVVNNHLDADGVLSVFALTHPKIALANEAVIIKAAEAGDFWAWAEGTAFNIFQELSLLFRKLEASRMSLQESFQQCFSLILQLLESRADMSEAEKILHQQYALVEQGHIIPNPRLTNARSEERRLQMLGERRATTQSLKMGLGIIREQLSDHVVSYHVPKETVKDEAEKFLRTAQFNESISDRLAFWPQVRNRQDAQKMQLVSVETGNGIHYDLWLPGYCWADTKGLWQPPGLIPAQTIGAVNHLKWKKLSEITKDLNELEPGSAQWNLFPGIVFANTTNPRDFPIILTTYSEGEHSKGSAIPLESVKKAFRSLEG